MSDIMNVLKEKFPKDVPEGSCSYIMIGVEEFKVLEEYVNTLKTKASPQIEAGSPERTALLLQNENVKHPVEGVEYVAVQGDGHRFFNGERIKYTGFEFQIGAHDAYEFISLETGMDQALFIEEFKLP